MARAGRSFEEGRIYHVYNRVGGGSKAFTDEELAATFVALLRLAMGRDGVAVLAWCLLGNHYHLVVRQGPVQLSRPMKTLQQGATRTRNLRCSVFGPLWQGRFMAKEVIDELGRSTARWRPRNTAGEWLAFACPHLECDSEMVCGRGRAPEVVRMRELTGLVGIERYGVQVTELAAELGKSRGGVSHWYRRGAARRTEDADFAAAAEALDQAASEEP